MAIQSDFMQENVSLQEAIETRGHLVLFKPKFSYELYFIKYYWGAAKLYASRHCGYNITALRTMVPEVLASVTFSLIWNYCSKTQRIIQCYQHRITYGTVEFKKGYKSQRRDSIRDII